MRVEALERAIELNERAVKMNLAALRWGRVAAHDPGAIEAAASTRQGTTAGCPAPLFDFEQTVDELLAGLSSENHALAVEIARLPETIRGFGLVKEANVVIAREKEVDLLQSFRIRVSKPA